MCKECYNKKYDRVSKKKPNAKALPNFKVDPVLIIGAQFVTPLINRP